MTKNVAVIFGGAGFIGTHLLRALSEEGVYRLVSVDYKAPKRPVGGVEYVNLDIRDLSALNVEGDIDIIYNLAAIHTTPGHLPHEYYETNIRGATEITAFARRKGVDKIVFTSSISVYGPSEDEKQEETPPTPESEYGWSKFLSEGIHRAWLDENDGRRLVVCRPAVIFGLGEGGNFTRLASLMKKGFFVYPGRKDTIKACFYVGDLVAALQYAVARDERYILFNGCYAEKYTLERIVETFRVKHFPKVRTFMVPKFVVLTAAKLLKPFSAVGLGIHPDRVMKLIRSTDIKPNWLSKQDIRFKGVEEALDIWGRESGGKFE